MDLHEQQKQIASKTLSKPSYRDLFQGLNILCAQGKQGQLYCIQCPNHAIICAQSSCSCRQPHVQCEYFQNVKTLHRNLNSKLLSSLDIKKFLQTTYNISDQVLKLQNQIKEEFNYFGLNDPQRQISKMIKEDCKGRTIRGQDFKKLKEKRQHQKSNKFQDSLLLFKKLISTYKINVLTLFHKLQQQIVKQHIEYFQKKKLQDILESEIVKSKQDLKILNNLINPNLRFQKTQKIFSHYTGPALNLKELYKACQGRQSLLLLIQNKYGKKFGVFSECVIEKNTITKNENKQSCLFSIDCNLCQVSNKKQVLFHSAYSQNPSGEWLTFEMFDDVTKQTLSFLKLDKETSFYCVNSFNKFSINGISQNPSDWGSYPQTKKIESLKDKSKPNLKIQPVQKILSNQGQKILICNKDKIVNKNQSKVHVFQNSKNIFFYQNQQCFNVNEKNDADLLRPPQQNQNNNCQSATQLSRPLPVVPLQQNQSSQRNYQTPSHQNIENSYKINLRNLPLIKFLHQDSDYMYDKRIKSKVEYDRSESYYEKIITKKINNTIQLTQNLQQDNQINCLAYSNKHGVLITCINQEILLTDLQHLQSYLATSQTNKKSLKKISTTIEFSGKIYLSPNQKRFLAVNNQELMLFDISSLKILSIIKNEHQLRHFVFVTDEMFVGWNFKSLAYVFTIDSQKLAQGRKLEGVQKCTSINVINEHIVACEKENQSQNDEGIKLIIYDKNGLQIKNQISLRSFDNPDMYIFNFTNLLSIFCINQDKQGEFSSNDTYGLILGYYDDYQQEPDRRYLCFLKGNLIIKDSQIEIRGFQFFLSPTQDRSFYYANNSQKVPFQVQIITTGHTKIIMIEKLQNIFFIDCTKQFTQLNLEMQEKGQFKLQNRKYFKGMCLMKNMLELQRRPPANDSNEFCDMICKEFDGEFLSLYIPQKQTELTVPFPASILVIGDNKIMRRYVIDTQQAVDQQDLDRLKSCLIQIYSPSQIKKVHTPVQIDILKVINLSRISQSMAIKQELKKKVSMFDFIKSSPYQLDKKITQQKNSISLFGKPYEKPQNQQITSFFDKKPIIEDYKTKNLSVIESIFKSQPIFNTNIFDTKPSLFNNNLFGKKMN